MSFPIHFPSGMVGQTCSYTAKFISETIGDMKAAGISEAQQQQTLVNGHWGYVLGKDFDGSLPKGSIVLRAKGNPLSSVFKDAEMRVSYVGQGKVKKVLFKHGKPLGTSAEEMTLAEFESKYLLNNHPTWSFRLPTQSNPAVGAASKSVGNMSDEDVATLFVVTKDNFAIAKGINIKGANPQLDLEVFDTIAKVTGYTPAEVKAKIENYKSSGKKLSALKKKVMAKKATTVTPDPVTPPPPPPAAVQQPIGVGAPKLNTATSSPVNPVVAEANPVTGLSIAKKPSLFDNGFYYETTYNGHKIGLVKEGKSSVSAPGASYSYATKKVWKATFYDEKGIASGTFEYSTKQSAQAAVENWAKSPKMKAALQDLEPKVQPAPVHVAPSQPAVQEALKDLKAKDTQEALAYKDEDVVKAYIKAKDKVAGDPNNPFTLYTKSEEFDDIIKAEMEDFGVKLPFSQTQAAIANYLGTGQKLSVLKKKMIKSGELNPVADTLKQTKAQKQFNTPATQSAQTAQQQVKDMSSAGVNPVGSTPFPMDDVTKDDIFTGLKNTIYAGMQEGTAYEHFAKKAAELSITKGQRVSPLDVMRAYDEKKAKSLGIANGQFYENKVATWASSPTGRAQIAAKQKAAVEAAEKQAQALKNAAEKAAKEAELNKKINENIPALPPDSVNYQVIQTTKAKQLQDAQRPWSAKEKDGLRHYTGGSYSPMNDFLRGETSYVSTTNREAINNAMDGMRPTQEEFLVRRGCNYRQFGLSNSSSYSFDTTAHMAFKDMIGKTVQDKGFTSTSVGGDGAFGGPIKLEVEVAKGTHGAYVDHISMHRGEREFILAPGTQYKVLRVEKDAYGKTVVRVRTIPGSHDKKRY